MLFPLVVAFGYLCWPATLLAHGALKSSDPARAARLLQAPQRLRLEFTEAVELSLSHIVLVRINGNHARDTIALSAPAIEGSARVLVATVLSNAGSGMFEIEWHITGKDGHAVRGTIPFLVVASTDTARTGVANVDSASAAAARDTMHSNDTVKSAASGANGTVAPQGTVAGGTFSANSVLQIVLRWLLFVSTITAIGATATIVVVSRSLARQGRGSFAQVLTSRAATAGMIGAAAVIVFDIARVMVQQKAVSLDGSSVNLDTLLGTTWGHGWIAHVAGATLAAILFLAARRKANVVLLIIPAVIAMAVGAALSGHAAAARDPLVPVISDTLHVLGGGAWIGALLMMLLFVAPRLRADQATGLVALRSFSSLALVAAAVTVLSGAVSAWTHLGDISLLFGSNYGKVLAFKLALFALVLLLGWRNQSAVRAGSSTAAVPNRGRNELLIALLLLAVTAVLVATPTPPTALH